MMPNPTDSATDSAARERHWLAQEAAMDATASAADRGYRLIHRALQADEPAGLPPDFAHRVAAVARRAAPPARQRFERWLPVWALTPFAGLALALFGLDGMAAMFTAAQRALTDAPPATALPLAWALCALASLPLCTLPWERWHR
jgi:hypothetical protein